MVSQVTRPFIYGRFVWPGKGKKAKAGELAPRAAHAAGLSPLFDEDRIAVEVLREFSATELVGKLYLMGGSPLSFSRADLATVKQQEWYQWYTKMSKAMREAAQSFYFDVEGSGPWAVLFLRSESDDSGPYLAIGLRY